MIILSNARLRSVVVVLDRGGGVHNLRGGLVTLCHVDLVLNADVPQGGNIKLRSSDPNESLARGVVRVFILRIASHVNGFLESLMQTTALLYNKPIQEFFPVRACDNLNNFYIKFIPGIFNPGIGLLLVRRKSE